MNNQYLTQSIKVLLSGCLITSMTSTASEVVHFSGFALDHNNEKYIYQKYTEDGVDKKRYIAADGRSANSLNQLAKPFRPRVSHDVRQMSQFKTPQGGDLELHVLLKSPGIDIKSFKTTYKEQRDRLRKELIEKGNVLSPKAISDLKQELEINKTAYQQLISINRKQSFADVENSFSEYIQQLGGKVRFIDYGSKTAEITIPAAKLSKLESFKNLTSISLARPNQLQLNTVVVSQVLRDDSPSDNISSFWFNGVFGDPWDVGIIDGVTILDSTESCSSPGNTFGGIQQNHPRLNHVNYFLRPGVNTTDPDGHPTNVAGIIYSNDATYTGIAYNLDKVYVGDCICNSNPDLTWMMSDAGSTGDTPEVVNLSCGTGRFDDNGVRLSPTVDLSDNGIARDVLIDDYDMILVQSAGNDGDISTTSSIGMDSGYNSILVASADDLNTYGMGDDILSDFSSRGPSQVLNRKKPDITAVGSRVKTTRHNWADSGVSDFVNKWGTSFSAPVVSGFSTLMVDHMNDPSPLVPKALLINHTIAVSDNNTPGNLNDDFFLPDTTSEWNSSWGWGYLFSVNAMGGSNVHVNTSIAEPNHASIPSVRYYRATQSSNFSKKATLVWNKHEEMNLTDLDLFVYNSTNGNEVARSYSGVDNVEQVGITTSDYVIKVKPYLSDLPEGLVSEEFALAGVRPEHEKQPPSFEMGFNSTAIHPGQTFTWSLSTQNTGELPAHNTQLQLILPPGFVVLSSNPQNAGTIQPGQWSSNYNFTIQAPCDAVSGEITMKVTSSGFGETFSSEHSRPISNIPSLSTLFLSPRNEGQVPQTFVMPITEGEWSMASTINRTSNTHLNVSLKTDQCSTQSLAASNIKSLITHNWVAINGQQTTNETDAIVYIEGNDGFGHSDYYRDQRWHQPIHVSPGESGYQSISLEGDIGLFQIDDLPRGIEVTATATNTSGFNLDIQRVDGDKLSGSSNSLQHDASSFNQMTVIGTGHSPAMVVSSRDQNLHIGGMELSVSELKDCKINSTLTDTVYSSGFEANETQDFVRESSHLQFPDQPSTNNSVTVPHSSIMNISTVSVEAWVRADPSMSTDGLNFIASKNISGTGFALIATGTGNNKRFTFEGNTGNGNGSITSTSTIDYDKWYHVVGVYTNGVSRLYVNGVLETETSMSGNLLNNNVTFNIGSSIFGPSLDWKGEIDEVRLWNRVLSQNEISSNAQACLSGDESGLIGYWRLDAPSAGSQAVDSSGNALNGTLNNVNRITP